MSAKVEVIRKRQIAESLAEKSGLKRKTAAAVVDFIFDEIAVNVAKGVKVNISDFGTFRRAERAARTGRNPQTGEAIKIKASVKPRFTASKVIKESMKSGKYAAKADVSAFASLKPVAKAAAPVAAAKKPVAKKPVAKKPAAVKKAAPKKPAAKKVAKKSGKKR